MVTQEVREIINRFVEAVLSRGIRVDKAILYGSYATGKENKDSDLDLAVISSDFGKDRFEEGTMLMKLAWRIDPRLHPVPLFHGCAARRASNHLPGVLAARHNPFSGVWF